MGCHWDEMKQKSSKNTKDYTSSIFNIKVYDIHTVMKKTADNSMENMMARCQYSTQNWQIYIYIVHTIQKISLL